MKKTLFYSLAVICAIGTVVTLHKLQHANVTSEVIKQIVFLVLEAGGFTGWWLMAKMEG